MKLQTIREKPIGGCIALLLTLACCAAAVGQDRSIAGAPPLASAYDKLVFSTDMEPLPVPEGQSELASPVETNTALPQEYDGTPGGEPVFYTDYGPWYSRWPVVGSIHRRWVTHTKPALQASHWGYPEYFIERPFGSDVQQAEQMQILNGLEDQQVLYHYDFLPGDQAAILSPRGHYQLQKIIRRMEIATCPIVIQTTITDPELDEARRQHVTSALLNAGVEVVPQMVVVRHPPVPGLQGTEGLIIYGNLIRQTEQRGVGFGGGGGGAGALAIPVIGVGTGGN